MRKSVLKLFYAAVFAAVSVGCVKQPIDGMSDRLPEPEAVVSDITCTSFNVSWKSVTDAGSYTYVFNDGQQTTTKRTSAQFKDLEPGQSYTFSVRTDAEGGNGNHTSSAFVNLRITTEGRSVLAAPEPVLVASYSSKTIIRWNAVYGASSYEYECGVYSGKVTGCSVELSGLEASTDYVFSLKAVSSDEYTDPSETATLSFTTRPESEDIPQIILAHVETGSDYSKFNVYAVPDFQYLYFGVPASYFEKHTDNEIRDTYLAAFVQQIKDAGVPVSTGISQYAKNGTASYIETPLYPETTYYIVAFGVNTDAQATTPLYKFKTKTLAEDTAPIPGVTGANWFSQRLFHAAYGIYDASNSMWFRWKGEAVESVAMVLTSTRSFKLYFDSDPALFCKYVASKGTKYSDESIIKSTNSADGFSSRFTKLESSNCYTMGTLAVSEANDTTFVMNSLPTKSSENYYDWAMVSLGQDASDVSVLNATFMFLNTPEVADMAFSLSGVKYYFCKSSELEGVTTDQAGEIVESRGTELSQSNVDILNMTGRLGLSFGKDGDALESETSYFILATFTESSGDRITRFSSSQTGAFTATKGSCGKPRARVEFNVPATIDTYVPAVGEEF